MCIRNALDVGAGMTITVGNKDLIALRRLLHTQLTELRTAPVMKMTDDDWKGVRDGVRADMRVLIKTIRKLNRAIKAVEGHECNAGGFYTV